LLRKALVTLASWLIGILGVVAIIWYYQPQDFVQTLRALGISGLLGWVALTLVSRISAAEATVAPLGALGFDMTRPDAFWISWVRTFANQFIPLAGVAVYAHLVRRRVWRRDHVDKEARTDVEALACPHVPVQVAVARQVARCPIDLLHEVPRHRVDPQTASIGLRDGLFKLEFQPRFQAAGAGLHQGFSDSDTPLLCEYGGGLGPHPLQRLPEV